VRGEDTNWDCGRGFTGRFEKDHFRPGVVPLEATSDMNTNASLIEGMLRRVPQLKALYDEHMTDHDALLPHVFMGDVTRFAIAEAERPGSQASVTALLEHLEDGLKFGRDEVKELIVVSFVENLTGETAAVKALEPLMGQSLKAEFERMCA
jgi:hypothetical protein